MAALRTAALVCLGAAAAAAAADSSTLPLHRFDAAPAPAAARRAPRTASPLREFSDTSTLAVVLPGTPPTSLTLRHSTALFGPLPYGGGVAGGLYRPRPNASDGCSSLMGDATVRGSVLLLDRGGCGFVAKALNAQVAGAVGAVIVDNLGICAAGGFASSASCSPALCAECPYYEIFEGCQCYLRYMADDGGGGAVNLPLFMVTSDDGALLDSRGAATRGAIFASMQWDLPAADGSVSYSVWSHSNDANAAAFRAAWMPYIPYLGGAARFQPHMFIWDGSTVQCGSTFDCATQCVNADRYCSADPDGDLFAGISGGDVVIENLRQLCVWQQVAGAGGGAAAEHGLAWWRYVDGFAAACSTPATWTEACAEGQMRAVGVDPASVRACMADSNATGVNSTVNKLLQQQLDDRAEMMIVTLPTVVVQDTPLRGGNTARNVLQALCASLPAAAAPPVCGCADVPPAGLAACVGGGSGGGGGGSGSGGGMPGWGVALIVCVLLGGAGTLLGVRHYLARTKQEVEVVLHDFRAELLSETGSGSGDVGDSDGDGTGAPRLVPARDAPRVIAHQHALIGRLQDLLASVLAPPAPSGATALPVRG